MSDQKRCPHCELVKPADQFYLDRSAKDGRSCWCRVCDNERKRQRKYPQTAARMVRNRARQRAAQILIKMHPDEFRALYDLCEGEAAEQADALAQSPALREQFPDGIPIRLRPGRRDQGESERIDQAWCSDCRQYHESGHHAPPIRPRLTTEEILEDVEWLLSTRALPEQIAERMGYPLAALAQRLYRAGRPDLGAPFSAAVARTRSESA